MRDKIYCSVCEFITGPLFPLTWTESIYISSHFRQYFSPHSSSVQLLALFQLLPAVSSNITWTNLPPVETVSYRARDIWSYPATTDTNNRLLSTYASQSSVLFSTACIKKESREHWRPRDLLPL